MPSRRQLLKNAAILATLGAFAPLNDLWGKGMGRKFRIGACDWSLGKASDAGAFDVARQIGLDGIMVDIGSPINKLHLREDAVQQRWREASARTGIKISSIAIAELNQTPYKSDPRTIEWVWDSVAVAKNLNAPVVLLAFFDKNDLRNDGPGKKEVVRRLKEVAPRAESMGVTLGIESYLNAAEHLDIIQQVGSPNLKVYLDCRNTADAGYDPLKEIRQLGKDSICELHMKENGFLLGEGSLDWKKISELLYELNYFGDGWMQIEWAMPDKADLVESYRHNLRFLRELFEKQV